VLKKHKKKRKRNSKKYNQRDKTKLLKLLTG